MLEQATMRLKAFNDSFSDSFVLFMTFVVH